MKYLIKFNEIKFNTSVNVRNPYSIRKIGQPLDKQEIDTIKDKLMLLVNPKHKSGTFWSNYFSKPFNTGIVDKLEIVKKDNQYYIVFLDMTTLVADNLDELAEIIYFQICLSKRKYSRLKRYLTDQIPTSKNSIMKKNTRFRNLVLTILRENQTIRYDMDIYEDDPEVIDLINYIEAYF